ncbi:MAG: DUF5666 domain-containing protein [Marinobacter sp.]|uniref:DUF5666 domain-containing protein n=1 Tax=Marinobacter sp. TaxID=50741 RepID=UPI00299CDB75|nr:DUF5666 domain-containing protein [Marinobacter sp.]MDX1634687.1 DUF5666 domain-containing protein [Marinobacter sp.]
MARVASILVRSMGLAAGVGLLASCGGGGGGVGGIVDGGIRGTGSSVGPVSGFASVFVNGIRFSTDGEVTSDDGITSESQLEKGMILRVDGEWRDDGQGDAERLSYDDTFRGTVADFTGISTTDGTGQFTILGQTITIDRQTVLRLGTATTLANGDAVRVSAWPRGDGSYRASFIGLISDDVNNDMELEGLIDSLTNNGSQKTFTINGTTIDFRDPVLFEGITEADLQRLLDDRVPVEVEGSVDALTGDIDAREIGIGESRRYQRGEVDDIEFSGPISGAVVNRRFAINGLVVVVDDDTEFDDGFGEADLADGLLIQVEGDFRSDGTVLAEEIELREANAKVEGVITNGSIDPAARTFEVGGVLVQVTASTIISSDDEDSANRMDFDDLLAGQNVEVAGIERETDGGLRFLEALKIEFEEDSGGDFEMEGRLTAFDCDAGVITVLGVQMAVDPNNSFEDVSCDDLRTGDFLEVEYASTGIGYFADEVELEENDED